MSDKKYTTYQQHEPLRVPEGWGASARRFIAQLEEIFDDLYRRFNRLKLKDLDESLRKTIVESSEGVSSLEQTATQISSEVSNVKGDVSELQQTAQGLASQVSSANGNISALQQSAQALTTRLTNAQNDISTVQQTANALTSTVASTQEALAGKADAEDVTTSIGAVVTEMESRFTQTSEAISAKVSETTYNQGMQGKLDKDGAAVSVKNTAVDISAGGVRVETTGFFQVAAGGKVDINGASGSMDLGESSQVSATRGKFDTLIIGQTTYYPIIASPTQPSQKGCFWAQYSNITQAMASFPTRPSRADNTCGFTQSYGTQASPHLFTAPASSDILTGTQFDYVVSIPFYRVNAGTADRDFYVRIVRGGVQVEFPMDNYNIVGSQVLIGDFTAAGQPNLFTKDLQGQPFTLIIYAGTRNVSATAYVNSNSLIQLTAKASGAAVGATACSLYYIP